jgi:hypothetical protein
MRQMQGDLAIAREIGRTDMIAELLERINKLKQYKQEYHKKHYISKKKEVQ